MKQAALRSVGLAGVLAAVALAAGCGGSGKESAAGFAKRITTEFSRGQAGRLWEDLLPAQQAIVGKARFLACEGNEGFGLQKIKVLETYDEAIEVDGSSESSKAVTLQVTSDNGRTTADGANAVGRVNPESAGISKRGGDPGDRAAQRNAGGLVARAVTAEQLDLDRVHRVDVRVADPDRAADDG